MGLTHSESKTQYRGYRTIAREMYQDFSKMDGKLYRSIEIPEHATVHFTEDGAFIEAVVWVPVSELKRTA